MHRFRCLFTNPARARMTSGEAKRMRLRNGLKWALAVLAGVFFAAAAASALGVFDDSPYTAIPHGDHSHYVPRGCSDIEIGDFPTQAPGPGERITCEGRIVPVGEE